MKLNIPKEWSEKRARLEEGCEIGAGSLQGIVGRTSITLTAQEIRHLAQFCGMALQEPTTSEAEDERETEIIIAPWPEKGVKGDDGMLPPHNHIAYLAEYPEEGCVPLGSPNNQALRPPDSGGGAQQQESNDK